MTACSALRLQLAAYVDDELGVDAAIEIERHLAECRGCRREMVRQRQLQRALRALHPIAAPPAGLEERARAALIGAPPRRTGAVIAVAAAIAVAAGAALAMRVQNGRRDAPAAAAALGAPPAAVVAAADAHRRLAADGGDALELATADVDAVNRWLVRRLPFAATLPTPDADDVLVEGASVVQLAERPAGLVRYHVRGREVSLFLLPRPVWDAAEPAIRVRNVEFRVFRRDGLELVGWSHAPLSYLLVADGGLGAGDACATCHGGGERAAIQEFVTAVAGGAAGA